MWGKVVSQEYGEDGGVKSVRVGDCIACDDTHLFWYAYIFVIWYIRRGSIGSKGDRVRYPFRFPKLTTDILRVNAAPFILVCEQWLMADLAR